VTFAPGPRSLVELVTDAEGARLVRGDGSTAISGVTNDSRFVRPGDLFVAVPGFERDGASFVPAAISAGAVAIAAQRDLDTGIPLVLVPDARRALADLAAAFYGHPSRSLSVVGVTGTDGKTSTTRLISSILEARGLRTGWLTTINTRIGNDVRPNAVEQTTPEAPVVQRTLVEMRAAGVQVAILETSSHALALERVRGVDFKVGVFTNLSPEHLNFHGSLEAYLAAKRLLFERLPSDGLAVLNADDPASEEMRAATRARVLTYALVCAADVHASDVQLSAAGTRFQLKDRTIETKLVGRFNVANWLAAYAAATYFGAEPDDLIRAAARQPSIPGRMELVDRGQPFTVVVDFAHTPQALDQALEAVRSLADGRVLLAFGLAGGRDPANRPVMGALAAHKSDYFVVTTDDPGREDPAQIADQIAAGARAASGRFAIQLDRRKAIRSLLEQAAPGDVVLLAGKGHEQRMVVGEQRLAWSDARAATELLRDLGYGGQPVP
jgi:UDP-N-acetylmuramoyl-L-alanyl-D-glutamate--2,6-diaminopimelate ligase